MSLKSQNITFAKQNRIISTSRANPPYLYLKRQTFNQTLFNQLITNRHNQNDNYCLYLHRFCLQNRLEGYNYCLRHILFDRNAPFKQCSYIHPPTNRRCPNAAKRFDRREKDTSYCPWHIKQFNLIRRKNDLMHNSMHASNEMHDKNIPLKRKFEELEHYCPSNEHDHRRKNADWDISEDKCVTTSKYLKTKLKESINSIPKRNQNDEDFSNTILADVLNLDSLDSDNESVESYMEDPLRHAGIFSSEEMAHILRDKMLRLQTLYINMLNYYRNELKNRMRQYNLAKQGKPNDLKNNSSVESPTTTADPLSQEEDLKMLKAMYKYHNISGPEKLIKDKASKIRQCLIEEKEEKPSKVPTCIYKKDTEQCQQQCIPLSNYCRTHILYDPYQTLYHPCAEGTPPCLTPVIAYVHKNSCIRHTQIKHSKTDLEKILQSPVKIESPDSDNLIRNDEELTNSRPLDETVSLNDNVPLNVIENEPELYSPMEDMNIVMDNVESGNYFSYVSFDSDANL